MSWIDWKKKMFEGLACSVREEASIVCPLGEDAPPTDCVGGRVRAFRQERRTRVSMLIWAWGRRTGSAGAAF